MLPQKPNLRKTLTGRLDALAGMTYTRLLLLWCALTVIFTAIYFVLSRFVPAHAPQALVPLDALHALTDSLYFSIITATSTGYGDIVPMGFSKVLVCIQITSSLGIFAVFVTKLVSRNQEATLREVHRLTYEDIFHNSREDLFLIRHDLDLIIEEAHALGKVREESWGNLTAALRQAQSIIQEIPDFYDTEEKLYTIDPRREEILLEAVHRTLHRIDKMLEIFSLSAIEWTGHEESLRELVALLHLVEETAFLWQERSPYQNMEAFADIIAVRQKMHGRIEKDFEAKHS
ncbi:MAG: potassium channel family protein [Candidatus Peregrinibacteria bacterium]